MLQAKIAVIACPMMRTSTPPTLKANATGMNGLENLSSANNNSYAPSGWETVGTTIAWIAFRQAVLPCWWDAAFYFGSDLWFDRSPERIMDELEDAAQSPNILVEDDPVLAKKLKNYLTGLHSVMGCRDAIQLHHSRAILLLDELENRESATKCEIEAVEEELAQARALQSK